MHPIQVIISRNTFWEKNLKSKLAKPAATKSFFEKKQNR